MCVDVETPESFQCKWDSMETHGARMSASDQAYRYGSGSGVGATVALMLSALCLMAVDPSLQLTGHPTHKREGNDLACYKYTLQ